MKTLNLIRPDESGIKYEIFHFPDGEVQIKLVDLDKKDGVEIICRVTNAEDFFIVLQVIDILERNGVFIEHLTFMYFMGMRMDRVMEFSRPFTLKILLDTLLEAIKSSRPTLSFYEPHNLKAIETICGSKGFRVLQLYVPNENENCKLSLDDQIVLPDAGAKERYGNIPAARPYILCKKVRDISTGKIKSIEVENKRDIIEDSKRLLVMDDLCDGGGTFAGVSKAIREINPRVRLDISVKHMVNPKGIETLSKNFDNVYITNSYKDWENLPENVFMTKIV